MRKIVMPRIDAGMKEGVIIEWLKKEGEPIQKGEPIAKAEGEKAVFDVEASESGVLKKILVPTGVTVPVGQPIAIITEEGEEIAEEAIASKKIKTATEKHVKATPSARRIAREHNIDLAKITGSGAKGLITEKDVLQILSKRKLEVPRSSLEIAEIVPLAGMRKVIADRMAFSYRTIPQVAITMEVDMSEALKFRETVEEMESKDIPLTALLTFVIARVLKRYPIMNSILEENQIKLIKNINVGIAVALEDGLVVPVVHDVGKKKLTEIASLIKELIEKATKKELTAEELLNGTFTITNLGGFGVDMFTPIINPPQTAILGVGKITERTKVSNKQIETVPATTLTLVFDHRVVDGAQAAKFLKEIKELLENPYKILYQILSQPQ